MRDNQHFEIANLISSNYELLHDKPLKKIRLYVKRTMNLKKCPQKSFTKYVLYHLRNDRLHDFSDVKIQSDST